MRTLLAAVMVLGLGTRVATAVPNLLQPSSCGPTCVALIWTGGDPNATGFVVERATTAGGPYADVARTGLTSTFSDTATTGIQNGVRYYWRVSDDFTSNTVSAVVGQPNTTTSLPASTTSTSRTTSTTRATTTTIGTSSSTVLSTSTSRTTSSSTSTSTSRITTTSTSTTSTTLQGNTPTLTGFIPSIGTAGQVVAVVGTRTLIYAASGQFGLSVIDATTSPPIPLGASNVPFAGTGVAVAGNRAVVVGSAGNQAALWVLDVTDPTRPMLQGTLSTAAQPAFKDVAINSAGTVVVATLGSAGLWTVDVSVPTSPVHVGTVDTPGFAQGVALGGTTAYVADGVGGLSVINVSNPNAPTLVASQAGSGVSLIDVVVAGTLVYGGGSDGKFWVIDVSTPSAPVFVRYLGLTGSISHLAVSGTRGAAVISNANFTSDYVSVIDLTSPQNPTQQGLVAVGGPFTGTGVSLTSTMAYVGDGIEGLKVVNPATLSLTSALTDTFTGQYVAVANGRGVVAGTDRVSNQAVLKVVNVSNSSRPVVEGMLTTAATTIFRGVAINSTGTLAVVTLGTPGLWTIDLATPSNPVHRGTFDTNSFAQGVALDGTTAYVADGVGGLSVINVSIPSAPTLIGSKVQTGESLLDVAAPGGTLVYTGGSNGRFWAIDVSTPSNPIFVRYAGLTGSISHIAVSGTKGVAIISNANFPSDYLSLIGLSTPNTPTQLSSVAIGAPFAGAGMALKSGAMTAYVGDGATHLKAVDLSNPSFPVIASTTATPGNANGVTISGTYAYVADSAAVIDVLTAP